MSDVARNLPQIIEKQLDPVEHSVKGGCQSVEFVPSRSDGHSLANISANDCLGGTADRVQPPVQIRTEDQGAAEAKDYGCEKRQAENCGDLLLDLFEPIAVDGDHEALVAGKVDDHGARLVGSFCGVAELNAVKSQARRSTGGQRAVNAATVTCKDRVKHSRR